MTLSKRAIQKRALGVALFCLLCGCAKTEPAPSPPSGAPAEATATFINKVWRVSESTGMTPGQLVVFLSEGTLVFASGNAEPTFGKWRSKQGVLTMIEEGIPYQTEILMLSPLELRIRSHNPGGSVDTRLVPAEGVIPRVQY